VVVLPRYSIKIPHSCSQIPIAIEFNKSNQNIFNMNNLEGWTYNPALKAAGT
jgi:hypothetical protein